MQRGWKTGAFILVGGAAGLLGGLLLLLTSLTGWVGILGLALLPLLFVVLSLAIAVQKPVYVAGMATVPLLQRRAEAPEKLEHPEELVVEVVSTEGICPVGYRFAPGETWMLNGELRGPRSMCPKVGVALLRAAERMRTSTAEEVPTVPVECRTRQHFVAFELRPIQKHLAA